MLHEIDGTIEIHEHCTFRWRQIEASYQRVVDIEPHHCPACIAELARLAGLILNDRRPPKATSVGGT